MMQRLLELDKKSIEVQLMPIERTDDAETYQDNRRRDPIPPDQRLYENIETNYNKNKNNLKINDLLDLSLSPYFHMG